MNEGSASGSDQDGSESRRLAIQVVQEVGTGARTSVALAAALRDSNLDQRDRAFVTELAHGSVRMQRSCDHLIDHHLNRRPDAEVRAILRVGTYQLVFLGTPPHAAVSATVTAARPKVRGFVNAVLRKVAEEVASGGAWPTVGVEFSYPDWFIDAMVDELGEDYAFGALEAMNSGEQAKAREDGFTQGAASVAVAAEVAVSPGDLVIDLCAAPGGKSTAMAAAGATVIAMDISVSRVNLLASMAEQHGSERTLVVTGDATSPPLRGGLADHVLVDAPCSGWGALGRRSDARWRINRGDVARLADVQAAIMAEAQHLVKPGGTLVYGVCTVTRAESVDVAAAFTEASPSFEPLPLLAPDYWRSAGTGGMILPQDHDTDGMAVFRWRRAS